MKKYKIDGDLACGVYILLQLLMWIANGVGWVNWPWWIVFMPTLAVAAGIIVLMIVVFIIIR